MSASTSTKTTATTTTKNSPANATLFFTAEPKRYYRFRYECDIGKSTHGVLTSSNSTSNVKEFPAIKLMLPANQTTTANEFYVLCLLCETANAKGAAEVGAIATPNAYKLSAHRLLKKVKCKKHKKYDLNDYKPICAPMRRTIENPNVYTFELDNYFIVQTVKEQKAEVIEKIYNQLLADNWPIDDLIAKQTDVQALKTEDKGQNVSLCLTVFTKSSNGSFQYFQGPIFSNSIYNSEPIQLKKVCNPYGSIQGGDEITILVLNINNENDFEIEFYELENDNEVWSHIVSPSAIKEFFKKSAIIFNTPKYDRIIYDFTQTEIPVYIRIRMKSANIKSNSALFFYKNDRDEPLIKRMRANKIEENDQCSADDNDDAAAAAEERERRLRELVFRDCLINGDTKHQHKKFRQNKTKLNLAITELRKILRGNNLLMMIEELNNDYAAQNVDGNTIFHDAIKTNEFLKLYYLLHQLKADKFFSVAINHKKDTLLHYACQLNQSDYIRALLGFGCKITAKNSNGETPLHLAIRTGHKECVEKFQELLQHNDYKNSYEEFKSLLSVYNERGFTVLHLAVVNDMRDFVIDVLKFCKKEQINVCAIAALGEGDTILHLAVANGLMEMTQIIMEYAPEAVKYENYAGLTALEVIENMFMVHEADEMKAAKKGFGNEMKMEVTRIDARKKFFKIFEQLIELMES